MRSEIWHRFTQFASNSFIWFGFTPRECVHFASDDAHWSDQTHHVGRIFECFNSNKPTEKKNKIVFKINIIFAEYFISAYRNQIESGCIDCTRNGKSTQRTYYHTHRRSTMPIDWHTAFAYGWIRWEDHRNRGICAKKFYHPNSMCVSFTLSCTQTHYTPNARRTHEFQFFNFEFGRTRKYMLYIHVVSFAPNVVLRCCCCYLRSALFSFSMFSHPSETCKLVFFLSIGSVTSDEGFFFIYFHLNS